MATADAALVQLADALVATLSEHDFGIEFDEVERSYADWDMELQDLDELRLDVVPVSYASTELTTREMCKYTLTVDVGIRKRFSANDQVVTTGRIAVEEIDRLVLLVEQINEWFLSNTERRLTGFDEATWNSCDIRSTYIRQHLRELRQFTGVMRVTYDYMKVLA